MNTVGDILKSGKKPKEKVTLIASAAKKDPAMIEEIIEYFENAKGGDRGNCIEALEYLSKENPEQVAPHICFMTDRLTDKAPKVRWEAARVIGNCAAISARKLAAAVEPLLENAKDSGTVVRWSAAFALSELAKHDAKMRKELLPRLQELAAAEENSGVRNVYLKAFRNMNL